MKMRRCCLHDGRHKLPLGCDGGGHRLGTAADAVAMAALVICCGSKQPDRRIALATRLTCTCSSGSFLAPQFVVFLLLRLRWCSDGALSPPPPQPPHVTAGASRAPSSHVDIQTVSRLLLRRAPAVPSLRQRVDESSATAAASTCVSARGCRRRQSCARASLPLISPESASVFMPQPHGDAENKDEEDEDVVLLGFCPFSQFGFQQPAAKRPRLKATTIPRAIVKLALAAEDGLASVSADF